MASVFALLEAFNRKEAAALGFFPCATASCFLKSSVYYYNKVGVRKKMGTVPKLRS